MRKEHKYLLLIVILLAIGVGYAFLNANLSINGTANIRENTWNVHFINYQRSINSTVTPISEPEIDDDSTTEISYEVSFLEPGDYYEFTVDVINTGTLDATVDSLVTTVFDGNNELSSIPDYLEYSITYLDGSEYVVPHDLKIKVKETIIVGLAFKKDITIAQYEEAKGKTFHFNMKLNSLQGDNTDEPAYVYTNSFSYFYVGEEIPNEAQILKSYQNIPTKVFLRLTVVKGIIDKIDLGYIYNGNAYFIPPYIKSDDVTIRATYEYLLSFMGEDECSFYSGNSISCGSVYGYIHGSITAEDDVLICKASDLYAYCEIND